MSKSVTLRFTNFETLAGVSNTRTASSFYVACLGIKELFKFEMFYGSVGSEMCCFRWSVRYSIADCIVAITHCVTAVCHVHCNT
jgi:hypothetical protein